MNSFICSVALYAVKSGTVNAESVAASWDSKITCFASGIIVDG